MIPDEGEIRLDGEVVHFRSPLDARRAGIETVYQDLAVAPALDIATNLFLGREKRRPGIHNMAHVAEIADRIHVHRLGRRIATVTPRSHSMSEVVAIMTGAMDPSKLQGAYGVA